MQKIYLARPGAQKEGPYTLDQINHDLATKKIRDTDFWAWHEGLPAWTPLYSVPGVSAKAWVVTAPEPTPKPVSTTPARELQLVRVEAEPITSRTETTPTPVVRRDSPMPKAEANGTAVPIRKPEKPAASTTIPSVVAPAAKQANTEVAAEPAAQALKINGLSSPVVAVEQKGPILEAPIRHVLEPKREQPETDRRPTAFTSSDTQSLDLLPAPSELLATPSMSSGKPFAALRQIFLFTTGEGPSALKSESTSAMLAEVVGRNVHDIQSKVPVDVIAGTSVAVVKAIRSGSIPGSAWQAIQRIRCAIAQQIQDGALHLCVRTFPLESKDLVALFLLYNK